MRGVEVSEATLSLEAMRAVCLDGPGHYLGTQDTLSVMQTEDVYPALGCRMSPKDWTDMGRPDLIAKAQARRAEIMAGPNPAAFPADLEKALRAQFDLLV